MSALALSRAIGARAVSCAETMRVFLDACARHSGHRAVVALRDEGALMDEARARDAELDAGRPRGWLHGIPFAVKDLFPAAGLRFTEGSPLHADRVSERDAPYVARIRAAGAVIAGRTNTPEWGLGSQTHNPVHGTTRNAYEPELTSGGSSGGAAVALALRIVAVADGSDHAGSLRNPAGWNGVLGLRPTLGRVPDERADVFSAGLSTVGPMARRVDDLAALLSTMAGPSPALPLSLPPEDLAPEEARGLRIGWLGDLDGHLAMEPGVLEACEGGLRALEAAGCAVEPARLGFEPERIWRAWTTLRHLAVGASLGPLRGDAHAFEALKPEARWEVEGALRLAAADLAAAQALRSEWHRATLPLFERHDVLALPTAQTFPFPLDVTWPREIAGRAMDSYHRWMEVSIPATMAGGPVLAVPGPGPALMGLQLWGPWRSEGRLLGLGRAYEAATGFPERRPPGVA
jgi:amidase